MVMFLIHAHKSFNFFFEFRFSKTLTHVLAVISALRKVLSLALLLQHLRMDQMTTERLLGERLRHVVKRLPVIDSVMV